MKFNKLRILTDENISPKVVAFLRNHGISVLDTKEQGWQGKSDDELLEIAFQKEYWILTHDSDFGSLAIYEGKPYIGVIFIRINNLKSNNVIKICNQLLNLDIDLSPQTLVVVEDSRIRIRQFPPDKD